jgi:predicted dehydrogenase
VDRVRVGVIGAGWWATQFHLPSLCEYEHADVAALVDPDPDRLEAAARRYGIERSFSDHRSLFDEGLVDAVVVAVPHASHYEIARDALDAGVHVLVEKPMVLRASDAADLVARSRVQGRHVVVGYTYQFTRHARRAREIVQSGRIGELQLVSGLFASSVEAFFRGAPEEYADSIDAAVIGPAARTYSDPALVGGGQGQTQVTHGMGMVFWVTGRRAVEVTAHMSSCGLAVDLVDAVAYRFDNGAVGTMASTGALKPGQSKQQEFRYYGSEGFVLQELIHGRLAVHDADGTIEEISDMSEDEIYPAHLPARALVDLVLGGGANPAPPEPAAATVEFLEAAYRSAAAGGGPVRVADLG